MKRLWVQIAYFFLTNANINGFLKGTIYRGELKTMCVPGLNCYSCPGALGSCPIGALQAVIGSAKYNISAYILGLLTLFGVTLGRWICGWLCPFGLAQELLHKIKTRKLHVPLRIDRPLRYLKYGIFVGVVLLMPMLFTDRFGLAPPYFCAYICPSGTLFAGIPLLAANESLRQAAGWLFIWKLCLLSGILALAVALYRPFCKYICPLGAFYALFNRVSLVRLQMEQERCIACNRCEKACPMQVPVRTQPNHAECIRCGACKAACPTGALHTAGILRRGDAERCCMHR